jgi:hypothetical protein
MAETKTSKKATGEAALLEKVDAMPETWRDIATRIHTTIIRSAPSLTPTTWYGMPGFANDGHTV